MRSTLQYKREIIHDCITLLVMADIQLFRNQTVSDQPLAMNFMVLCRLLKIHDTKSNELFTEYQQIIRENTVERSTLTLSADVEFRAVPEVIQLLNPKWKVS